MTSPVWRFKQRCERAAEVDRIRAAAAAAEQQTLEALSEDSARYELLVVGLNNDRARISALPQGSGRLPLKKECCAVYLPYVESYIKAGKQHRNEVLVQVMIWLFDLGDIAAAMRLAEIAIDQKQPMPERFKSTVSEFVADSVLEWAAAQHRAGNAVAPYFDWVFDRLIALPLHDVQRAKYYKFAAERAAERGAFTAALALCDQAITYDAGAKVKTLRDRCAKEVARLAEAAKHSLRSTSLEGSSTAKPHGEPESGDGNPKGCQCPTGAPEKYPEPAKSGTRGPWPKGGNFSGNDTTPAGGAAGASGDAAKPQDPDETGAPPASSGDVE